VRGLLVFVCVCLLASCGGGSPSYDPPSRAVQGTAPRFADTDPHDWVGTMPWHYSVHGIDVSKYQGDIDWSQVRTSGVGFAFIKATEGGDYLDERFAANWEAARRAGLPRGAYHYYYFCRPAVEQVAWFINHVPRDSSALPPVLDLEWNHRSRTCPYRPDPNTVRNEASLFLKAANVHYGKRPIIYTTVDFYRDNELWRLDNYPFWLRSVAGHPSDVYPGQRWSFWQYTGTGVVDGIDGPTDLNVFSGSFQQIVNLANGG